MLAATRETVLRRVANMKNRVPRSCIRSQRFVCENASMKYYLSRVSYAKPGIQTSDLILILVWRPKVLP
jgi:hypothetical protein